MSAALSVRWQGLCDRLGVKPRQFAALLAIASLAVGALAARSMLRPARPATRQAPPVAAAASMPAQAPAVRASDAATWDPPALHVRPARDPFRPFFAAAGAEAPAAEQDRGSRAPLGRAPTGMVLKAVIAGEYAVIGNETVGIGDEVADGEGRRFVVEEIHERRVVLREGSTRAELGYSAGRAAAGAARQAVQPRGAAR